MSRVNENVKKYIGGNHCVSQKPVHPSFGRVLSQNDGQKLSKLHYKGGNARAVMQKLGRKHGQLSNPS